MIVIYLKLKHKEQNINSLLKLNLKATLLHSLNIQLKDYYNCKIVSGKVQKSFTEGKVILCCKQS